MIEHNPRRAVLCSHQKNIEKIFEWELFSNNRHNASCNLLNWNTYTFNLNRNWSYNTCIRVLEIGIRVNMYKRPNANHWRTNKIPLVIIILTGILTGQYWIGQKKLTMLISLLWMEDEIFLLGSLRIWRNSHFACDFPLQRGSCKFHRSFQDWKMLIPKWFCESQFNEKYFKI